MSKRLAEFDEKLKTITQTRGADYGPPAVDFGRAMRLKAVVGECQDPLARHVMEMVCVKLARLIQTPSHLDSWLDIAGYARCGVEVTDQPATQSYDVDWYDMGEPGQMVVIEARGPMDDPKIPKGID